MPTSYQRRKREQAKAHRRDEAERRRRERAAEKKALERAQAWSKSYSLTDWRRRWKDRVDGIEVPHLPLPSDRGPAP